MVEVTVPITTRDALKQAKELASELNSRTVEAEHLLIVLADPRAETGKALQEAGLSRSQIEATLREENRLSLAAAGVEPLTAEQASASRHTRPPQWGTSAKGCIGARPPHRKGIGAGLGDNHRPTPRSFAGRAGHRPSGVGHRWDRPYRAYCAHRRMAVTPQTMHRIVMGLQRRGLVSRAPAVGDRKSLALSITGPSPAVLANMETALRVEQDILLCDFSQSEFDLFFEFLGWFERAFASASPTAAS